jgi:hypothetical protein
MAALAEDLLPEALLPDEPNGDSAVLLSAAAAYTAAADAAEPARLARLASLARLPDSGSGSDAENVEPPAAAGAGIGKPNGSRSVASAPMDTAPPASAASGAGALNNAPAAPPAAAASAASGTASGAGAPDNAPAAPSAAPAAAPVPAVAPAAAASGCGGGEPASTEQTSAAEDAATAEPPAKKARKKRAANPTLLHLPPVLLDSASEPSGSRQLLLGSARPELLTSIFSLLGAYQSYGVLSLVNKHWRVCLQEPEIWTDLSYKTAVRGAATWLPNCRTYYQLIALLRQPRFKKLKSLCLPTGINLGKKTFCYMSRVCPHITYLNISNATNIKVPQMQQIAEYMPQLTTFIMAEPTGALKLY